MTNSIEKEILFDVLNNPGDTFYENVLSDFLDEQGVEHDFRKPLHNNKITEIKLYQKKCLDIWKSRWINIGLCTKPTDENKAEQYFFDFYKELGFSTPKKIVWIDNPVEMCCRASDLGNQMLNKILNQISSPIEKLVWHQIGIVIRNQVRIHVWDQVYNYTWGKIYGYIWSKVWVLYCMCNNASHDVKNKVWNYIIYGQQNAYWLAYYAYMMQVLRMEFPKPLVPFMLLAQEVNWWISTEQTVFVTRKPKECIVKNEKFVKVVYQDNYTIT
jgi:hypothetical protein